VKRREFIAGLGGAAAAWPLAARAQQGDRIRRVGVLMNSVATNSEYQSYVAAFIQGLRQLGWIEGQNLRMEVRWNAGNAGLASLGWAGRGGGMVDCCACAAGGDAGDRRT
jgi:putative tryptophan/tyrosine transport system substrate-binding protein